MILSGEVPAFIFPVQKIEQVVREHLLAENRIAPKNFSSLTQPRWKGNLDYPTDTNLLDKGRKRLLAGFKKLKKLGRKINTGRTFARKAIQEQIRIDAELLSRVIAQTAARYAGTHLKNEVYSLHKPQVTCIAKGKRGKQTNPFVLG